MLAILRRLFDLLFWWIVVLLCISCIGFIVGPLLTDKFYNLCASQEWQLCRGQWLPVSSADEVQKILEDKTGAFLDIAGTAVSDVLTDRSGKKKVTYEYNTEVGVYMPVDVDS